MNDKLILRILVGLLELAVLAGAGFGLYKLLHGPVATHTVAEEEEEEEQLQVPTDVAVRTGVITRTTLHRFVTAWGTVEPAPAMAGTPAAGARVSAPSPSVVAEVDCVEGEHIEKGQTLFSLDSRWADLEIRRAQETLETAQASYLRYEESLKKGAVPEQYALKAEAMRDQARSDLEIAVARKAALQFTAPLTGTVTLVQIRPGEVSNPQNGFVELADLDRLVIVTPIPGAEVGQMKPGQTVRIDPQPGEAAPGQGSVIYVDNSIDPKTGMGEATISIPASGPDAARPGELRRVHIVVEEHRDCLAAPAESVVTDSYGQNVIALVQADIAVQQLVDVGLREGNQVEIRGEGIKAGQTVVTTGSYGLPSKTRIHVVDKQP